MREVMTVPKEAFFQAINYRVYDQPVLDFHRSKARIRIAVAPARTSKSYSGAMDLLYLMMPRFVKDRRGRWRPVSPSKFSNEIICWIVSPSYGLAREFQIIWDQVVTRECFAAFGGKITAKAAAQLQGDMRIRLSWGKNMQGDEVTTQLDVKSSANLESLQADEVEACLLSESAEQASTVWYRYLSPRVKYCIMPTTPKMSADWLYKMCQMGEADPELSIESFQYTPRSNPGYDWKRFWQAHALAEARVLGKAVTDPDGHDCFSGVACKASEDHEFAEQCLGSWSYDSSRVLPFRWTGVGSNVLDRVPLWVPHGKWYASIDHGFLDPACVIFWSVGTDGQIVAAAEIYESKMDPEDMCRRILAKKRELNIEWAGVYSDPQAPNVESFLRKFKVPIFNVNKAKQRDRKSGFLRLVNALTPQLATGIPRLHVLSEKCGPPYGCPKLIHEWRVLRRRENVRTDPWVAGAWVGEDHGIDAARYFLSVEPTAQTERWDVGEDFEMMRSQIRTRNSMLRMASGLRGVS